MAMINANMPGKICMVTGANSGVGKATALGLAQMGATVVMVCRNRAKGEAAQNEIKEISKNNAVDLLIADLSSQESIQQLAKNFQQRYTHLHVLLHNAGVFMMHRTETVDGIEMTFAVNYLAPFLLTDLLLDTLKASAPARIIIVSSDSQASGSINLDDLQGKKHYRFARVYAQSKLAVVMYTYELAQRLEGTGITVNCLHPGGFVATNLGQEGMPPFLRKVGQVVLSLLGTSPEEGAKTSLYLASSPKVENITGRYFVKCVPKRSAEASYDKSLQRQVWEEGTKLIQPALKV
jgi:NAD(P)-dependent dehydrogenase (short-subunit alcohol dehydrogenase family)